jgi:guanylate kinase
MLSERVDDFLLLILSSPSGAGKTTLSNRLRGEFPNLRFSVSHTTRRPRPTEVDGREYHFVDRPSFEKMIRAGAFAEHAEVHGVLFDIDYQGARQIKAHFPEAVGVFVLPPSLAELERRLRGRGTEDEATTNRRLAAAKGEIAHYGFFDYVIVNDDVDQAYGRLRGIVLAERCKRERWARRCESLLSEAKREASS